jgi:hypothetical protein
VRFLNFIESFKNARDAINFLFVKEETILPDERTINNYDFFYDYEVVFAELSSNFGTKLSFDTRIIDYDGVKEYATWNTMSGSVKYYIQQNLINSDFSSINLHIRMRAPQAIYSMLTKNTQEEYKNFDLTFMIDANTYMVSTSSIEKKLPIINVEPSVNWDNLIQQYIYVWSSSKNKYTI